MLVRFLFFALTVGTALAQPVAAPRFWTDSGLAEWATPIAGLNVRPSHINEREYYAAPSAEWVRTYPVYFPGKEPVGYFEKLSHQKPEPIITPGPRTAAAWIAAGKQVFQEMDVPAFRSYDPKLIAIIRSATDFPKRGGHAQKDGTVMGVRWIPTAKGLALSIQDCAGCHTRVMPDGSALDGAQANDPGDGVVGELVQTGSAAFFFGDSPAVSFWRGFSVPWIPNDVHSSLKTMSNKEIAALNASNPTGTFARFNGSPFYVTRIPDLIGIKNRKYIDATATHRLRGPEDVMRYSALVSCCDNAVFGPHHALSPQGEKIIYRFPDDMLYALAQYIYSLEPPRNPNPVDARAANGKKVFDREGCAGCHTPPYYTNNKLTPAKGYTPPRNHPLAADILPVSVGTDANLALNTRKGTGFYKIPSLQNIWYRGLLGHDGAVSTLEEWFDPARLRDDYVPSGFKGYKVQHRAVPGHEFGLKLAAEERTALIAFLRTL